MPRKSRFPPWCIASFSKKSKVVVGCESDTDFQNSKGPEGGPPRRRIRQIPIRDSLHQGLSWAKTPAPKAQGIYEKHTHAPPHFTLSNFKHKNPRKGAKPSSHRRSEHAGTFLTQRGRTPATHINHNDPRDLPNKLVKVDRVQKAENFD